MSEHHRVVRLDELWGDDMQPFEVAGCKLLLIRLRTGVYAYEDRCAHQGAPLSQGCLDGDVLTCAMHHWQYDARSGCGINPPHVQLRRYPVTIRDGQVYVSLDPEPERGP